MNAIINIHFIINPISGSGKALKILDLLDSYFNRNHYELTVKTSKYKHHAIRLAQDSVKEKAGIIVACGGDGTINEVASCLVNSSVILGIIPMGSGNGLASHLKIPKSIPKALARVVQQTVTPIDVGCSNGIYFFSNTGIGFDAKVINYYEASKKRKLSGYFKACSKALKQKTSNDILTVHINDTTLEVTPFLIFVSNSNELGYKVSLTPEASLQDGLLDVLIVSQLSLTKAILLGLLVLFKKHHLLNNVRSYKTKSLRISQINHDEFLTQIDGESHTINNKTLNISILKNGLNVIV